MTGLCPNCGKVMYIIGSQGKEGSSFHVIQRRCDACKLTVQTETVIDYDDDAPPDALGK